PGERRIGTHVDVVRTGGGRVEGAGLAVAGVVRTAIIGRGRRGATATHVHVRVASAACDREHNLGLAGRNHQRVVLRGAVRRGGRQGHPCTGAQYRAATAWTGAVVAH